MAANVSQSNEPPRPLVKVTVTFVPVNALVELTLSVGPLPCCVTVTVCPAMVRVPVREVVAVLAATLRLTVPLPEPLAPAVTVIQVALLVAVHAQPVPAVTVTLLGPPAAVALRAVADRVYAQAPACVTVTL